MIIVNVCGNSNEASNDERKQLPTGSPTRRLIFKLNEGRVVYSYFISHFFLIKIIRCFPSSFKA